MTNSKRFIFTSKRPATTNLKGCWLRMKGSYLTSRISIWQCGQVMSSDKIKMLYLYFHRMYETWHSGDLGWAWKYNTNRNNVWENFFIEVYWICHVFEMERDTLYTKRRCETFLLTIPVSIIVEWVEVLAPPKSNAPLMKWSRDFTWQN